MKVLITGSRGFIGKNLISHLNERSEIEMVFFTRDDDLSSLKETVANVGFIFHLAGVNRPNDIEEFNTGNTDLTRFIADSVEASNKKIPVIYISSSQAVQDNPYGNSKRAAEEELLSLSSRYGSDVYIFRLPNVFGKWSRPNYNSVVATFCHNVLNDLPIQINDSEAKISLVYIDDVVEKFIAIMDGLQVNDCFPEVRPEYNITVGGLAEQLYLFKESRENLITEPVGNGLVRALYSTYLSYFSPKHFSYAIKKYADDRGVFSEMLKTRDSGQFSFFTTHPGITRGGHYHHSKTEKFLVVKGSACFRFSHIETGEVYELRTDNNKLQIVETVPGWSHNITNEGDDEMIVMLWANEIFDRDAPDTYASEL